MFYLILNPDKKVAKTIECNVTGKEKAFPLAKMIWF